MISVPSALFVFFGKFFNCLMEIYLGIFIHIKSSPIISEIYCLF